MIFVKSVKNAGGYDTNNNLYAIMNLICDNESDLPQPDYFISKKYIIAQSSTAEIISTGAKFEMQSGGNWVLKVAGTATYTKAEIDTMIQNAIDQTIAQIIPLSYGLGVQIPNNSDFNTYTIAGVYYVGSNSAAATMENIPAAFGGRLEVKYNISNTYFFQEYTTNSTPVQKFIRRKISSGFTSWQSVTYT